VYQPNDAAVTGIGSSRKAPCLGYTPRAGEVSSLTQRYGPVAFTTCGRASKIILRRLWPGNGLFSSNAQIG